MDKPKPKFCMKKTLKKIDQYEDKLKNLLQNSIGEKVNNPITVEMLKHQFRDFENKVLGVCNDQKRVVEEFHDNFNQSLADLVTKKDLKKLKKNVALLPSKRDFEKIVAKKEKKIVEKLKNEINSLPTKGDIHNIINKINDIRATTDKLPDQKQLNKTKNEIMNLIRVLPQKKELKEIKSKIGELEKSIENTATKECIDQLKKHLDNRINTLPTKKDMLFLEKNLVDMIEKLPTKEDMAELEAKTAAQSLILGIFPSDDLAIKDENINFYISSLHVKKQTIKNESIRKKLSNIISVLADYKHPSNNRSDWDLSKIIYSKKRSLDDIIKEKGIALHSLLLL